MTKKNDRQPGVKMGTKIPGVIKDPVKVKPIPMSVLKKIMGIDVPLVVSKKKDGGEAVPPKFKGFSKLPESVQQQMNPDLAEKFGMGGDVKGKKSANICRGRGIARSGTGFTIR